MFCSGVKIYKKINKHENVNKIFMEVNFMKLKVPTNNLVKFEMTRVRFGMNRRQDSRNFTQKS
jgi:hypothetical protein